VFSYLLLGLIRLIALLPFRVLYVVSDGLFLLIYRLLRYRVKVTRKNLRMAFPQKPQHELDRIERAFYRHLCDIMVETIKSFSISEAELRKRMKLVNPELLDSFYQRGIPLIGITGHYGNWEWAAISLALQSRFEALGLYLPLKAPVFNKAMMRSRSRFRLSLVSVKEISEVMAQSAERLTMWGFVVDQSPGKPEKALWVDFLHQETPVAVGTEKYARTYNKGVVFGRIRKLKRGYYTLEYEVVCELGEPTAEAEITRKHTAILERIIAEQPEYWLWTHKRWKHRRPQGLPLYPAYRL
jgi:KDO2-lipid IV(A) lauroyltransferase